MPTTAPAAVTGVRAVLFDTFGTVVDWRSGVTRAVAAFAAAHGWVVDADQLAREWRARYQPAMERVRSGERDYVELDVLHRENLQAVLQEHAPPGEPARVEDAELDEAGLDELNRCWHRSDPWPDSVPGLTRLRASRTIGALSNGSVALLSEMAEHAGLPWDVVVGSDLSRAYKPDPRTYAYASTLLGLPPEQLMLCAAHNSDLAAARRAGFRTAFVPRPDEYGVDQRQDLEPTDDWDLVVTDLVDLADRFDPGGGS